MERISKEDLELLHGKMIAEKELTILGFKNKLKFEITMALLIAPIIEVVNIV